MSKLSGFMIFSAGVAAGVAFTYEYFKKKYEEIAKEDIESVKKAFSEQKKSTGRATSRSFSEMKKTAAKSNHYGAIREKDINDKVPYVIAPENFGEFDDYKQISLTYYSDDVLADEDNDRIEDSDSLLGPDALNSFGQFEDDSVFVRDDEKKRDYEILFDNRKYSDVRKFYPKPVIDE